MDRANLKSQPGNALPILQGNIYFQHNQAQVICSCDTDEIQ